MVFLFAAGGFLLMMFLHESAHITRWGRPLGGATASADDPQGFGVRNGASKASATTVGSAAVVIAVILPVFIPTLHLDGLGLFGPGGQRRRRQGRQPDRQHACATSTEARTSPCWTSRPTTPTRRTSGSRCSPTFNGVEWTSGNRSIVSDQTASGLLPYAEQGLAATVPTDPHNYTVTATKDFDSTLAADAVPGAERDRHRRLALGRLDDGLHRRATTRPTPPGLRWTMTSAEPAACRATR